MSGNRLLVCVSSSASSADLVRRGMEMARTFGVEWIAVHVQTTSADTSSNGNRSRAFENLQLAERLGARVQLLSGRDIPGVIVDYALRNHVTRIIVGKKTGRDIRRVLSRSIATRLLRRSGAIDVYVMQGAGGTRPAPSSAARARSYLYQPIVSVASVAAATAVCRLFSTGSVGTANVVMVYLFAVFSVSVFFGWVSALTTSILAVIAFNFFYTRPYYTLNVYDPQYLVVFSVMIFVALVSSGLAARMRFQADLSNARERRTRTLFQLSKQLSEANGEDQVCAVAGRELSDLLGSTVIVVTREAINERVAPELRSAANWSASHGRPAGSGTDNFNDTGAFFLPLSGRGAVVAVVEVVPSESSRKLFAEDPSLFGGMTSLVAFALEREQASVEARERLIEVENEKMRNAVLRGISHDLRTPLAAISGSATTLLRGRLDRKSTRELVEAIVEEAEWMGRAVENMLRATRLDAEGLQIDAVPETIDDLVTAAVDRVGRQMPAGVVNPQGPAIRVELPEELVVVEMDLPLMEQVLINILDNAMRYSPRGSPVSVSVRTVGDCVELVVEDEGPGIREVERPHIFEKFFRGESARSTRGTGLGLWISSAVVTAHRGKIEVENRENGGARFRVSLPKGSKP